MTAFLYRFLLCALLSGAGTVALAVFEWSGTGQQALVVDWTDITTPEVLESVTATIAGHERSLFVSPTALGEALEFAHGLFRRAPAPCQYFTLDVSGDGRNNQGPTPETVYARADWTGILVNGLAIGGNESSIADYYAEKVIRGPGAFVAFTRDYRGYAEAIERKLTIEIGVQIFGRMTGTDGP